MTAFSTLRGPPVTRAYKSIPSIWSTIRAPDYIQDRVGVAGDWCLRAHHERQPEPLLRKDRVHFGVVIIEVPILILSSENRFIEIVRFLLLLDEINDSVNLIFTDERNRTVTFELPGGINSMSPLPSRFSASLAPRIVRLSMELETWKAIRVGKLALITPVMTSG